MVRVTMRYDGKVLVPDEPIPVPVGVPLRVTVEESAPEGGVDGVLALEGLGSDVWDEVDPIEYQRREREGWR